MKCNNLEKKASEIKSLIINGDPHMDVIKISPSSGVDLYIFKEINGAPTSLAYFYPGQDKVLWSNPEHKIFFENLKERYQKKFKQELEVEEWRGYETIEDDKIEQNE